MYELQLRSLMTNWNGSLNIVETALVFPQCEFVHVFEHEACCVRSLVMANLFLSGFSAGKKLWKFPLIMKPIVRGLLELVKTTKYEIYETIFVAGFVTSRHRHFFTMF